MLKSYLKRIHETVSRGDATEESYYSALETLLKEYAKSTNRENINVTILPKKTEAGNPDFRVWDGEQHIVGYIEAKPMTTEYLDQIETTEQLRRYLSTFPNIILTNFFEFRLYRNGSLIDKVQIARPFIITKLGKTPKPEKETRFNHLLEKFFSFSLPKVYDAKMLAIELAKRTRFLKEEIITQELIEEEKQGKEVITGFYTTFKKHLISGLTKKEFADLYSQTITYGLFAARTRSQNGFNRRLAYDNIPHTIGILREVFRFISLEDIPSQMEWIVDDISEVLAVTNVKQLLHNFFHEGKGKDPIVHFYETFLAEYDPTTREKRGVYYTPEPVVSYIVRSLHHILREYFNRKDGFASEMVTVLDPAAGTLTFLAETAKLAMKEFISIYGDGGAENFIREHILKNFYAFELMMAPYAVGHLKISFLLEELGYKLQEDDRFKFYLTNTLEIEELSESQIPLISSLSQESHLAGDVKKQQPILVIIGNPPYSGHSANASVKTLKIIGKKGKKYKKVKTWIGKLIDDYKFVDNHPLGERNPKWLQDDYVKFIRFAQWKINKSKEGVLGFITNHSYLDNPTFRGMRQLLMNDFAQIYIYDLHGSTLKGGKCPDGSKDENVFDIKQGVAIILALKTRDNTSSCDVYHSEIWGSRETKYRLLLKDSIKTTKWKKLSPKSEYYLFVPSEKKGLDKYSKYHAITHIFTLNSVGVVTARDNFAIDADKENLVRRIRMLCDTKIPDDIIRQTFGLRDKSNWKLRTIREKLSKTINWKESIIPILYRPFDTRWVFYHDSVVERSRKEIMRHMLHENMGVLTCRQQNKLGFNHVFMATNIVESCVVSNKTREINYLFPIFLYPDIRKTDLFSDSSTTSKKQTNISTSLMKQLSKIYKIQPKSEQILYYIYSILYSNIYRLKYVEFLKIDFPKIPFTSNYELFKKLQKCGEKLASLHLLKVSDTKIPISKFQGKGDNTVKKVKYEKNRVLINKDQYFENIEKEIWEYKIGSYQVCEKWLKDRKGRKLTLDDIKHYCKIVTAIAKTIEIQREIDKIYPEAEKEVIEFEK